MEWINIRYEKPEISQPYVISINSIDSDKNTYIYNYYAYYNVETGKFYEYDSQTAKVGQAINLNIIGWLKGLTNYFG